MIPNGVEIDGMATRKSTNARVISGLAGSQPSTLVSVYTHQLPLSRIASAKRLVPCTA